VKASQNLRGANVKWKDLLDAGCIVAGSPQTIADRLNDMADKLNVGHVMVLCHYGNMPNETVYYNTTRFAREVMPKLQNRFSEYEDKWWPKSPINDVQKPAPLSTAAE
jgi:alkanesulfonate monooxygenase SsuD/methylene tetrahydromethanopterin reductase-like flavin-dependent oxidoreductase (luciferase family)